ncbi:amidase family protein [Candidatus Mycoplasma mahonii]|uniref:amidase family protein n=1 Tax=Candidatus Mycoplasma mahonii TaxID=3004105 RepID=UPI0026F0207E|nr:amidase family protein [Candidatus Mycoplasma mahonii]WKX02525.1 amidase family protein [Candidatus Mycoplasma mahonii]
MIKNQGNFEKAKNELKNDLNNAVAHIYEKKNKINGPLSNVVITLKDLYATDDAPTQASSKILEGFEPKYNAEIVNKLLNAGANIVGKMHLDELALGGTGMYSSFGKINNPIDSKRMPGGSSAGSVATMTKNISIAIGSDTGDSIRLPASYCGLVGFKPSYGAVSRFGMYPFASSLDVVGWFSHNVNDAIEVSKILYGFDKKDFSSTDVEKPVLESLKPQKIIFLNMKNMLSDNVSQEYDKLKSQIKSDKIEIITIEPNIELFDLFGIVYSIISFSESSSNNSNLSGIPFGNRIDGKNWEEIIIKTRTNGFGRMVQKRFALGSYFLLPENKDLLLGKAQKIRRLIKNYFDDIFQDSILVYPTAGIAPLWTESIKENWYKYFLTYSNFIGNPSISIPWIKDESMPVNLSIDGKIYDDKKLLSYSLYIEKLLGDYNE